jgi:hypothetical protein
MEPEHRLIAIAFTQLTANYLHFGKLLTELLLLNHSKVRVYTSGASTAYAQQKWKAVEGRVEHCDNGS